MVNLEDYVLVNKLDIFFRKSAAVQDIFFHLSTLFVGIIIPNGMLHDFNFFLTPRVARILFSKFSNLPPSP